MLFDVIAWLTGEDVSGMEYEEKGVYIDLLCIAWSKVGIPNDPKKLQRMLGLTPAQFKRIWKAVGPKWEPSGDRLFNERLEKTRKEFHARESVKKARGKKGAEARWGKKSKEERAAA